MADGPAINKGSRSIVFNMYTLARMEGSSVTQGWWVRQIKHELVINFDENVH